MKRRSTAVEESKTRAYDADILSRLNESLHEMSQPMTVLLCTLEYGVGLQTLAEMRETVVTSQEQCERLQKIVLKMQAQVRDLMEEPTEGDSTEGLSTEGLSTEGESMEAATT